jgi:hypothetical protein
MASIPQLRRELVEIVCMFEKELSTSFINLEILMPSIKLFFKLIIYI